MLSGHAHNAFNLIRLLLEPFCQQGKLDSIGAGEENEHFYIIIVISLFETSNLFIFSPSSSSNASSFHSKGLGLTESSEPASIGQPALSAQHDCTRLA